MRRSGDGVTSAPYRERMTTPRHLAVVASALTSTMVASAAGPGTRLKPGLRPPDVAEVPISAGTGRAPAGSSWFRRLVDGSARLLDISGTGGGKVRSSPDEMLYRVEFRLSRLLADARRAPAPTDARIPAMRAPGDAGGDAGTPSRRRPPR